MNFSIMLWMMFVTRIRPMQWRSLSSVKKKVVLLIGFRGTNYHGLQMNPTQLNIPTIENELRLALTENGYILPSNSLDLSKIDWSRSSRTDRGVHAARLLISAKLELPKESVSPGIAGKIPTDRFPDVVGKVNKQLPEDIRLFSCRRISKRFSARTAGFWRSYEYIFPLNLLRCEDRNQELTDTELLSKLNMYLSQLTGCQDFHNFHRMSGREVKRRNNKRSKQSKRLRSDLDANKADKNLDITEVDEEDFEVQEEKDEEVTETPAKGEDKNRNHYENWREISRPPSRVTRSVVFQCFATLFTEGNTSFVKVSIVGQHFLLHQIRLMMSAAILSTIDYVPDFFISLAVLNPILYHLPLAPPNGLVLIDAGFKIKKTSSETIETYRKPYQSHTQQTISSDQENFEVNRFLSGRIYPQVIADWMRDDQQLVQEYLETCRQFMVPPHLREEWRVNHDELQNQASISLQEKRRKDIKSIRRNIDKVLQQNSDNYGQLRTEIVATDLLPRALTSSLAVHFKLIPGRFITDIILVLASKILRGELSPELSTEDFLHYVEKQSAISILFPENHHQLRSWVESQTLHPFLLHDSADTSSQN